MKPPISRIGLGCSSFSTFFDDSTEVPLELTVDNPRVQEWFQTMELAVQKGITLFDTAPWYGHGTSETVIGLAIEHGVFDRNSVRLQTKVGRYEADPRQQFDFSPEKTIASVKLSIQRMKCNYIDVLQLHDPEFAPNMHQILRCVETMRDLQKQGLCREIGLTGYPLAVQQQILQACYEHFGGHNIFQQTLTYCHYNLHDTTLEKYNSTLRLKYQIPRVLAAAPLSMGLLTQHGPPDWHPASPALRDACRRAAVLAEYEGIDLAHLAIMFALDNPHVECTLLGMKHPSQVESVMALAARVDQGSLPHVLSPAEQRVYQQLRDSIDGPFAQVWKDGSFQWDGVAEARKFWKELPDVIVDEWQAKT